MNHRELTDCVSAAKTLPMQGIYKKVRQSGRRGHAAAMLVGCSLLPLGAIIGCVSVNAPDKPIVIELNINIKQEVVYRLAQDAEKTIDANPGIF